MLMKVSCMSPLDTGHPQVRACATCGVRSLALFRALDVATLEQIHTHIAAPVFEADEAIYARGQPAEAVFTIRSGVVRFERFTEAGDRRIVRLAGLGDLIGQEALLGVTYAEDARACTPVQLCRIPASLIHELGEERRELLQELMRRWQRALDDAGAWAADLTAGPARRRMLKLLTLLDRHADEKGAVWLPGRQMMGDMLDITEETASRIVSGLRREGIIKGSALRQTRLQRDKLVRALRES